jgi:hypothetical protein
VFVCAAFLRVIFTCITLGQGSLTALVMRLSSHGFHAPACGKCRHTHIHTHMRAHARARPPLQVRICVEEGAGNRRSLVLRLVSRELLGPSDLVH